MRKVAVVTGAGKRIGASIAKTLHQQGMNIIVHYHHSQKEAQKLCDQLNETVSNSAVAIPGDIRNIKACKDLVNQAVEVWRRLDVLVNNASSFYPTPMAQANEDDWDDLIGSNLKGPFFLSQAAASQLQANQGNIVNIVDIHADRPLKNYPIYSIAKAGLAMLTKSLARELAPNTRVNAVAPGVILWPNASNPLSEELQRQIVSRTCLKREGNPQDIADTVLFLIQQNYITGQIIEVDGGRNICINI